MGVQGGDRVAMFSGTDGGSGSGLPPSPSGWGLGTEAVGLHTLYFLPQPTASPRGPRPIPFLGAFSPARSSMPPSGSQAPSLPPRAPWRPTAPIYLCP